MITATSTHDKSAQGLKKMTQATPPALTLARETPLSCAQLEDVATRRITRVTLGLQAAARMRQSHALMDEHIKARALIYGVTTGYGPLATTHLAPEDRVELGQNLLYHLSAGVGDRLPDEVVRGMMLTRASSLAQGASGVSPALVELLLRWIEHDLCPHVPALGSVGASGDLTPLAHMALAMIGHEQAWVSYRGQALPARQAIKAAGLEPLRLADREALALVNGTSAMCAMAALNDQRMARAMELSARSSALIAEACGAQRQAWAPIFGQLRPHPGQQWAHERLGALIEDSQWLTERGQDDVSHARPAEPLLGQRLLQDPYSSRCAPQLLGALHDTWRFHHEVVTCELNAVTDNPVMDLEQGLIYHGGNFYGQHVATASDTLKLAMIKLMVWSERKIARLCDPHQSAGLPAFLTPKPAGLHSGFMGAQVTATALVAWARARQSPASIQSISTNNHNQDVVPMGTIAALEVYQLTARLFELLAIELMVAAQAVRLRRAQQPQRGLSSHGERLMAWIEQRVCPLEEDRPLSAEITTLARALMEERGWELL